MELTLCLRCGAAVLVLFAMAAFPQSGVAFQSDVPLRNPVALADERRQALELLNQGHPLAALPLLEDLAAAHLDDVSIQVHLAECLLIRSRTGATAEEIPGLRKRALEAVERAWKLGDNSALLKNLLLVLNDPGNPAVRYSENAEANAKMIEGELDVRRGDNQGALAAYAAALKIDPKLFSSAAFAGALADERRQALKLLGQGQLWAAMPLVEDLANVNPDDAAMQVWLAECLSFKSRTSATAEEIPALRKRALESAERGRKLGDNSTLLRDLLLVLNDPSTAEARYTENKDASAKMKEGELAFGHGDYPGALAAYGAALKLDPKLYTAALFAGDVCFRTKDLPCSSEWFVKAVAINPAIETAYRYWGDALMAAGKMAEAREKYVEAVIADPSQKPWGALKNWAQRNNCKLLAPRIDRPQISDDPAKIAVNPEDVKSGRSASWWAAWLAYSLVRANWRQSLFGKNYPNETQYRHSLAEESAALEAAARKIDSTANLDPQLENLLALNRDGLLQAWIVLSGTDAGIARDYPSYRAAHHDELLAYLDKHMIWVVPPVNPPN